MGNFQILSAITNVERGGSGRGRGIHATNGDESSTRIFLPNYVHLIPQSRRMRHPSSSPVHSGVDVGVRVDGGNGGDSDGCSGFSNQYLGAFHMMYRLQSTHKMFQRREVVSPVIQDNDDIAINRTIWRIEKNAYDAVFLLLRDHSKIKFNEFSWHFRNSRKRVLSFEKISNDQNTSKLIFVLVKCFNLYCLSRIFKYHRNTQYEQ